MTFPLTFPPTFPPTFPQIEYGRMKALIKSMENNDKGANVGRQSAEETIADVPGLIPAGEDGREEDNIFNVRQSSISFG